MSALEYLQYLGFGTMNAGFMITLDTPQYKFAFGLFTVVFLLFAIKTRTKDKHE